MRVAMVSWEYPPLVVGGLGRTCARPRDRDGTVRSRGRRVHAGTSVRARRLRDRRRPRAAGARRLAVDPERQPHGPGDLGQPSARPARRAARALASRRRRTRTTGSERGPATRLRRRISAVRRHGARDRARTSPGAPDEHDVRGDQRGRVVADLRGPARHLLLRVHGRRGRALVPAPARQDHDGAERRRPDALSHDRGHAGQRPTHRSSCRGGGSSTRRASRPSSPRSLGSSPGGPRCGACSSAGARTRRSCAACPRARCRAVGAVRRVRERRRARCGC